MGMDKDRFVHLACTEQLICSICTAVFVDPVQCPDEHLFCRDCIRNEISSSGKCPVDGRVLKFEDLGAPPRVFNNILESLNIKCDYHLEGCEEVVMWSQLADHLEHCTYRRPVVHCGHKDQSKRIKELLTTVKSLSKDNELLKNALNLNCGSTFDSKLDQIVMISTGVQFEDMIQMVEEARYPGDYGIVKELDNDTLRRRNKNLRTKLKSFEDVVEKQIADLMTSKEVAKTLTSELKASKEMVEKQTTELKTSTEMIEKQTTEMVKLSATLIELQSELKSCKDIVMKQTSELVQLTSIKTELKGYKRQYIDKSKSASKLRSRLNKEEATSKRLRRERDDKCDRAEDFKKTNCELEQSKKLLEEKVLKLELELSKLAPVVVDLTDGNIEPVPKSVPPSDDVIEKLIEVGVISRNLGSVMQAVDLTKFFTFDTKQKHYAKAHLAGQRLTNCVPYLENGAKVLNRVECPFLTICLAMFKPQISIVTSSRVGDEIVRTGFKHLLYDHRIMVSYQTEFPKRGDLAFAPYDVIVTIDGLITDEIRNNQMTVGAIAFNVTTGVKTFERFV